VSDLRGGALAEAAMIDDPGLEARDDGAKHDDA
jgi:hypothetical protein